MNICGKLLVLLFVVATFFSKSYQDSVPAKEKRFKLLTGDLMPFVGFGTYQIGSTEVRDVLDYALGAGYRLIDTAKVYGNEADIGKALKELLPKYNLARKDIFITTKLSPADHGEGAYAALEESLKKLDCGYIDLYLIHWPGTFGSKESSKDLRDQSWQQLVKGVKSNLTRNIGVSNYNVDHMKELLANDHGIEPAVNQVEWHPHYHQAELLELCRKEGILLQAYSSLGGTGNTDLIKNEKVNEIAKKIGKSPAQVLLRWALQQDIAVLPKSKSKKHIEENIDLDFTIPEEDMKTLGGFSQNKYSWDPTTVN